MHHEEAPQLSRLRLGYAGTRTNEEIRKARDSCWANYSSEFTLSCTLEKLAAREEYTPCRSKVSRAVVVLFNSHQGH